MRYCTSIYRKNLLCHKKSWIILEVALFFHPKVSHRHWKRRVAVQWVALSVPAELWAPACQGNLHWVTADPGYGKGLQSIYHKQAEKAGGKGNSSLAKLKCFNISELIEWNDKCQEQLWEHYLLLGIQCTQQLNKKKWKLLQLGWEWVKARSLWASLHTSEWKSVCPEILVGIKN